MPSIVFCSLAIYETDVPSFVEEKSKTIPNYDKGDDGEKLAAHMMGRWKSGAYCISILLWKHANILQEPLSL